MAADQTFSFQIKGRSKSHAVKQTHKKLTKTRGNITAGFSVYMYLYHAGLTGSIFASFKSRNGIGMTIILNIA